MSRSKIFVVTILVTVLTITGCGAKPASDQNAVNKTSTVATAKPDVDAQKAKEKAYYDAVKSSFVDYAQSLQQFTSIAGDYNSSKSQELLDSSMDVSSQLGKIDRITPPTGYENVQAQFAQGSDALIKAMSGIYLGESLNDAKTMKAGLDALNQSEQLMLKGIDEMKNLLNSHGVSY